MPRTGPTTTRPTASTSSSPTSSGADPDGTHVGYLHPRELADRYSLDGHEQTLERQTEVLTKLAGAAGS
jgi:hypothetical protein